MPDLALPFTPRLPPLPWQAAFLRDHGLDPAWGLFAEQGTGKTKALIDNAVLLFMLGLIDALVVCAPKGPHKNWELDEIPKNWPADAPLYRVFAWDGDRVTTKAHAATLAALEATMGTGTLPILLLPYDSLMTEAGKQASWRFLRRGRTALFSDESQRTKNPAAAVTKRWLAANPYAPYRRLASGTPADTPFDFYSQVRGLDPNFWRDRLGIDSAAAYRAHFGEFRHITLNSGKTQEVVSGYCNLDELATVLQRISTRVEKADVLSLLPKVHKRYFHPLTPAQRRAYEELKQEAMTVLDSGELVTAGLAIVLASRLSRVAAGHLAPVAGGPDVSFEPNPREEAMYQVLRDQPRQSLAWHIYAADVPPMTRAITRAGGRPLVYDSARPQASIDEFRAHGDAVLIGNTHSTMSEGWTLTEADLNVYWSRSDRTIARRQSEDRTHRLGQARPVTYVDLLAQDTRDAKQLDNLRAKSLTVATALGDDENRASAWLRPVIEDADLLTMADPRAWLRDQLETPNAP